MNWICKLLGHNFEPEINPIGMVYTDFVYYKSKMKCKRKGCKYFYKSLDLEPLKGDKNGRE